MTTVVTDLAADVVAGCRILDAERLTDAFGHLSARDGDGSVLITPRIGPGLVRGPEQLLRTDADGEVLDGDAALLPGEAAIHFGVLRARPDVAAVCRFHGAACLAWSALRRPLLPVVGSALMFGTQVEVYDTALTVTTAARADELAQSLGDRGAVLLRGFGAVTVGASVAEAVVRATFLERVAAATLAAHAVDVPEPYPPQAATAFLAREAVVAEQVQRAWMFLRARHLAP